MQLGGAGAPPRRRGDLVRLRATTWRSCACPGLAGAPRAAARTRAPGQGTSAAILGFPENGPYDVRPARLGQHLDRGHPGRLRPRAGAPLDHVAARPRAPGQLGRAGGRRPRAAWSRRSSPRRSRTAAAAASACPTRSCADALAQRRRARSTPAPALGERGDRGVDVRASCSAISCSAWARSCAQVALAGVVEVVAGLGQLDLEAPVAPPRRGRAGAGSRPRPRRRRRPRRGSAWPTRPGPSP